MAVSETNDVAGQDDTATAVILAPNSPDYRRDPYPTYERLRTQCPVAHSDQFGGFWMLSREHDVRDAARNPDQYTSRQGITLPAVETPPAFFADSARSAGAYEVSTRTADLVFGTRDRKV
jgi:cytochrome P450